MNHDNYPPGFDRTLLDEDDSEERDSRMRREEDDANFADQEPDTNDSSQFPADGNDLADYR